MNLNQITRGSKVPELSIIKPTVVHFIPDFGKTTYEMIHNSGLRLANCYGIITKSRQLKLGGKTFNARKLYLDAKSNLSSDKIHKTIPVFQIMPKNIGKNKYIIIDHTITSQATQYITELTSSKRGLFFLFQQLNKEFKFIKSSFTSFENVIVFGFNGEKNLDVTMFDLIKRFLMISPEELNTNFKAFDNHVLASINIQAKNSLIFPIMGINDKGNVEIYNTNISMLPKLLKKSESFIGDEIKVVRSIKKIDQGADSTPLTMDVIKQTKVDTNVSIKNGEVQEKLEVNQKQLSKILKKYKIRDKTIGDNIKASMDNYITSVGSDANEEDAEQAILKAIHLTIFGTPEIHDEYKDNPAKLISKLEEVNTYSKKITIPKMREEHLIEPSEVIALDRVTGLVRQEYEFSDNIHKNIKKLFKTLENRTDFPIKIVEFKHDYQDNNLNRVINYEITLQNQAGGHRNPYTVNIKVPALVNDRYFKLNGKTYIMANQQYFVPVTKTAPNECRLLTPYATLTIDIVNMKFGTSEIDNIIEYIESRYSDLIKEISRENGKVVSVTFKSGAEVNLLESPFFKDSNRELTINDHNKYVLKQDGEEHVLNVGKTEFIFDRLVDEMQTINPDEKLRKTTKSIPFMQVFISGVKLPLIQYMWQQLGLINALNKLGMNFKIAKPTGESGFHFPLANSDEVLIIDISKRRDELIANGLMSIDHRKFQFSKEDLNDKTKIEPVIQSKFGTRTIYYLNNNTENMIDPISADILEFQDKPTNVINLITEEMIDKLMNDAPDSLTDLRIYRSRQAEIMFHLMYKNLMMAHNEYKRNLNYGDEEAKLFLVDTYIIDCLLGVHPHSRGSSVLDFAQPYTPVSELKAASKLIKTGPGKLIAPLHGDMYRTSGEFREA